MYIRIDFESETPIYLQLVHRIIEGIAGKELQPGEALPSVRALAADIGINLHTVNKAYQYLKQEGFILIHRRKGVLVNPEGAGIADAAYRKSLAEKLRPIIAESICRNLDVAEFQKICAELYTDIKEGKE